MPRDYKNSRVKDEQPRPAPGWVWLLTGILVGLFAAFLLYLRAGDDAGIRAAGPSSQPPTVATPAAPEPGPAPADKAVKPKFDFYTILRDMEIQVPEAGRPTPAGDPLVKLEPGRYMLQAGSFRKLAEADRLKAKITLLGLDVSVESVAINGNDTWHRVRIGPIEDARELAAARARLSDNGIGVMVLKLKSTR